MTDLQTAAQQALEALEDARTFTGAWPTGSKAVAALRAALAQQEEPVEPVAWVASKDGRVIYDDTSKDDGLLRVSGDFENDEQRVRYAQRIVDKLNAAPAQQAEPVADPFNCPKCGRHDYGLHGACPTCDAQQAEPVQEPVATVVARQYDDGTYAGNALDWAGRNCENDFPVGTKLYTAPPQRKLVPLTEEEIDKIFKHLCDTVGASCKTMARAVEKASWEKNHG